MRADLHADLGARYGDGDSRRQIVSRDPCCSGVARAAGDRLKPAEVAGCAPPGLLSRPTIGNLSASAAVDLLRAFAATLGRGAQLLIGIDRVKSSDVLLQAYDDSQGVTAAFNLNLLERINRELEGTIPVERFRHVARWNDCESRIEMHLEATRDVAFSVSGFEFRMTAGETIHTENSLKYGEREARLLLRAGGWSPMAEWLDPEGRFAVILAATSSPAKAP